MGFDREGKRPDSNTVSRGGAAPSHGIPGKSTLVDAIPVQMRPAGQAPGQPAGQPAGKGADPAAVHAAAAQGTAGSGSALPHLDAIQRSFGSHDVSGIQAHTDGAAASATAAMGAEAFATGDHVAFSGSPSLHTAAHEAAHVVQQRAGVHLKGGVGEVGDAYERHADAVADRVVAGESAQSLLDQHAPGGGGGRGGGGAIQRVATKRTASDPHAPDQTAGGAPDPSNPGAANSNKAARTGAHPLDDLREAITAGNAAKALSLYQALVPADKKTVSQDSMLLDKIVRLDGGVAVAILRECVPDRAARFKRMSDAQPTSAILADILKREGIVNAAALAAAAAALAPATAFCTAQLLDPIIAAGATAAGQGDLAATGEALLKASHPGKGPLEILPVLAGDLTVLRDRFEHAPSVRAWVLTQPQQLLQKITAAHQGLDWARVMWTSPDAPVLAGWINGDKPQWGAALGDGLLATGTSVDGTALGTSGNAAVQAVLSAIASVKHAAGLGAVLAKVGMALAPQIHAFQDAKLLDAASLPQLINRTGVTAAEQAAMTSDDAAVGLIRTLLPAQRAEQVLTVLAQSPAAFAAAIAPQRAFTEWVTKDRAQLWTTMTAVVAWDAWLDAFRQLNGWALVLDLAGVPAHVAVLRPHVVSRWNWLVNAAAHPVGQQAQADAILALYGDGAGIVLADKYTTWKALYRAQLALAGQDHVFHAGGSPWTWEYIYRAVSPDDDAMNLFFHQFRQMPRTHVDAATGVVMAATEEHKATNTTSHQVLYQDGHGGFTPTPTPLPMTTSYYLNDNWIAMRSASSTGAPDTANRIQSWGGAPTAVNTPGVDPLSGGTVQPMTMFQNHATHEAGHAVGTKTLNRSGFNVTGDDWTRVYGNWQKNGTPGGYATMCGWSPAHDAHVFPVVNPLNPIAPQQLQGSAIKTFLVGLVQHGTGGMGGDPVAIALGGAAQALAALNGDPVLSSEKLVQNVFWLSQLGDMPGMSYTIPVGPAPGAPSINFFCTRWDNAWVTYDADCWHHKVSHYGVSSYKEMFAEMYTAKFTGGGLPPVHNGHDPAAFFTALQQATPAELGLSGYTSATPATPGASASPQAQGTAPGGAQGGTHGAQPGGKAQPAQPQPQPLLQSAVGRPL